jgi:protein ImuA
MHPATKTGEIMRLRARLGGVAAAFSDARSSGLLASGIRTIDACLDGGLAINAVHEIRCELARDAGSAAGFALGLLSMLSHHRTGHVLVVSDPALASENSRFFPHGLAQFGIAPDRFVLVRPIDVKAAMWAADEAAKCHELMACIFHLKGNPAGFDLTATRRLMLRARTSGVFTCLLRQSGRAEISAAASRWCIAGAPSPPPPELARGIGDPCFTLTLERNRSGPTGQWAVTWNPRTKSFGDVSSALTKDRLPVPAAPGHRPHRPAEMGQVVAFGRTA